MRKRKRKKEGKKRKRKNGKQRRKESDKEIARKNEKKEKKQAVTYLTVDNIYCFTNQNECSPFKKGSLHHASWGAVALQVSVLHGQF